MLNIVVSTSFSIVLLLQWLVLVVDACAPRRQEKVAYEQMWPPRINCYSCMSKVYEKYWDLLRTNYFQQRNFSDACNDESFDPTRLAMITCEHVCVVLKETIAIAGISLGKAYIRGCIDKVVIRGFNESAIDTHRFRLIDQCRSLDRRQLMRGELMSGVVQMCSCYKERSSPCNYGAPSAASPSLLMVSSFTLRSTLTSVAMLLSGALVSLIMSR